MGELIDMGDFGAIRWRFNGLKSIEYTITLTDPRIYPGARAAFVNQLDRRLDRYLTETRLARPFAVRVGVERVDTFELDTCVLRRTYASVLKDDIDNLYERLARLRIAWDYRRA